MDGGKMDGGKANVQRVDGCTEMKKSYIKHNFKDRRKADGRSEGGWTEESRMDGWKDG